MASTVEAHLAYRATVTELAGGARAGMTTAVICVTERPALLEEVIANHERQRHPDLELIVVTNSADFGEAATRARIERVERARLLHTDPERSLGSCLNLAIETTQAPLIAKFDDDDHYGAHYLSDAVLALQVLRSAVVGKHSYFAHLVASDRSILRFPGHEFVESRFLAGGTLVFDRAVVGDIRFADVSVGEDTDFLRRCWSRGLAVHAVDHFNYVQRRGSHNRWQLADDEFSRDALDLGPGERLDLIDV